MHKVTCEVFVAFEAAAKRHRLDLAALVEGLPLRLDELRDPSCWMRWDTFATLCERAGPEVCFDFGREALRTPLMSRLTRVARLLSPPRVLYEATFRWLAPWVARGPRFEIARLGRDRHVVEIDVPSPLLPSIAFLRAVEGAITDLPMLIGLPPTRVVTTLTRRHARYEFALPRVPLWRRLPLVPELLGRGVVAELTRQDEALRAAERARDRLAEQSRNSERAQAVLLQNLNGMAYRCRNDDAHTVELVTAGSLALTGYTPDELRGNRLAGLRSLIHPDDAGPSLSEQQTCSSEYRLRGRDGAWRWVLDIAHGVYDDDGTLIAVEGFMTDVTRRHLIEAQLAKAARLESLGQLAGGIAHDFNNLLTAILSYAHLATRGMAVDDPRFEDLEQIADVSERAARLTSQLLSFGRNRAATPRVVDLNQALDSVETLLRRVIGEHVELHSEPGEGLWPVTVDLGQLEQVLINLAVNARDAMPEGGVLTLTTGNVELDGTAPRLGGRSGPHVVLTVADTGVGIPDVVRPQIFEPCFTTKAPGHGTGLGLATCQEIISQAGGVIDVESEVGVGSRFRVYLPRAAGTIERRVTAEVHAPRGHETILLVEDDAWLRHGITKALVDLGYRVLSACDGLEALDVAQRYDGSIDLVVTDIVMPGINGDAVASQVRKVRPEVAVLMMSGYDASRGLRGDHAGVPFLAKPFSPRTLAAKIREVLDIELPPRDRRRSSAMDALGSRSMRSADELSKLAGKLGGLPVLGCRPGSPAAQAGIRYGDIVLSVNGQPTPDWSAYMTARATDPQEMIVEVFRDGEHVVHRLALTRNEAVDPYSLLTDLIEQRVLSTSSDPAPPAEPS